VDTKGLEALRVAARVVASLDQPAAAESGTPLGDLVAADENGFEDEVERRIVLDRVLEAVDGLEPMERDVLRIRFGLDGRTPASLQATASELGIGVRRARQAEARALERLAALPSLEDAHRAA